MAVATGVRRVAALVVDRERGEITCLVGPAKFNQTWGRAFAGRRISRDEEIVLRKTLTGQSWDEVAVIVARALSMPAGAYIRCKLPA